ncbi:MAG: isoleucine--tRNA ligase [bacterium]|nr:isoleucine--tRNA ligase [bacterium]
MDYRETLNLPQTKFKMKANLTQREPQVLKRWEKARLYDKLQAHAAGKPLYVLHDGPPYANGNIHLGTAFNKVLKDIILRSRRLLGFNAPYIPGWDCHGLPIEHNVDLELGEKKRSIPLLSKRAACRSYAEKWIKIQREQFKRLGVLGDWENPYQTMNYGYEATIAREFNKFLLSGAVIRAKKPVYWCATCTTALAEAEVDYADHTSPSIYVKFPFTGDPAELAPELAGHKVSVVIWTTTPWTLPANLAIALHPDFQYAAVAVDGEVLIIAAKLVEQCMQAFYKKEKKDWRILATLPATVFEGKHCRHPFMERDSLLVLADYVTDDSGTGCVHTAPGHGADDYQTGLRYGLDILSPMDDEGRFTAEAGKYAGEQVPAVNSAIIADLQAGGALLQTEQISHSYPHCWRCKEPVMYRATPQWFISMDKLDLRQKALAAIKEVTWTPAWGQQRIYGMIEARPDWCLSRQRTWGVPLTVLTCTQCEEVLKDEAVCDRIDELFRKEGADAWFKHEAADFVPEGTRCSCGAGEFRKETDILDVWFDSGTSHAAVLEEREELRSPADLYLEGSDQHRGWFHSSLLTSVGTRGRAPYTGVLTHGYVVDGQGKKMSKSVGNVVAPQEVIDKYGAEVLRLWVSSENYQDDIKVSDEILKHVTDAYRKMRNTLRFLLSNLYDFDPEKDALPYEQLTDIDRWALGRFADLGRRVCQAYERYEFHTVYHGLYTFCGTTISSIYLDVLKDRLYCSAPESVDRRAAQTVIHRILDGLLRLMSPILCFTSEEAWQHLYGLGDDDYSHSVFFAPQPDLADIPHDSERDARWQRLLTLRSAITRVLEIARRDKLIGLSLDAEVLLKAGPEWRQVVEGNRELLQELCIVSSLRLAVADEADEEASFTSVEGVDDLQVAVQAAPGTKCERCWRISLSVGGDNAHPSLCNRCASVVTSLAASGGS